MDLATTLADHERRLAALERAADPGPLTLSAPADPVRSAARDLLVEVLRHRATITVISAGLGALAHWLLVRVAP